MPITRRLLREEVTYSDAKEKEVNILHQLGYYDKKQEYFTHIDSKRSWIKGVVAHHLGLRSPDACHVADLEDWFHGSSNVCVPITIANWKGKQRQQPGQRVLLRLPLPYRVGEAFNPGNGDEKVRCEAGTYAWLQGNCPDVPIPRMYGFGMSTGETFTHLENLPFLTRYFQCIRRRLLSWFGRPVPSRYIRHQRGSQVSESVDAGYILIEYIEEKQGEMLSNTWPQKQHDTKLRTNLFRDLSRILLSFCRISLPRIGSFIIDNSGFLSLTNRPLRIEIQGLENEGIPTDIPRDYTYTTVDSYVADILAFHDSRIRNQPNAVNNVGDCAYQMAALAAMRTICPLFFRRDLRRGPFVFNLTDLHQSNIFVDENWHITSLVDLEWACSQPIEMVEPPHWLSNQAVDLVVTEEYDKIRTEFMDILIAEGEQRFSCTALADGNDTGAALQLPAVMKQAWEMGTFWYTFALASPTGLFSLFYKKIQPRLIIDEHEDFTGIMSFYWSQNLVKIVARKLSDKDDYDLQLQQAFENSSLEE